MISISSEDIDKQVQCGQMDKRQAKELKLKMRHHKDKGKEGMEHGDAIQDAVKALEQTVKNSTGVSQSLQQAITALVQTVNKPDSLPSITITPEVKFNPAWENLDVKVERGKDGRINGFTMKRIR